MEVGGSVGGCSVDDNSEVKSFPVDLLPTPNPTPTPTPPRACLPEADITALSPTEADEPDDDGEDDDTDDLEPEVMEQKLPPSGNFGLIFNEVDDKLS